MLSILALESLYIILGIAGALLLVMIFFAILFVGIYNTLVRLRERYKNAFAQIDVSLQRRYDLIPNLVETAKGYMKHESETLERVVQARNQAVNSAKAASANPGDPTAMTGLINAESQLTGALSRLMVVVEDYPDLKANENMLQVQEELTSTENKVAFARQAYNDAVMAYNTQRSIFPNMFVASVFNFSEAQLFEVKDDSIRQAPKVNFTN